MRGSTFRPNAATRELWLIGGVLCGSPLRPSAYVALDRLTPTSPQPYRFTAIVNASDDSEAVVERSIAPGQLQAADRALNLPYPAGIFSLSHLAIPIPMDDPLYGLKPDPKAPPEFGFSLEALLPASPILQYRGVGNVCLPVLPLSKDRCQFMPARRSTSAWSKASTRINPRRGYSRSVITYTAPAITAAKPTMWIQFRPLLPAMP